MTVNVLQGSFPTFGGGITYILGGKMAFLPYKRGRITYILGTSLQIGEWNFCRIPKPQPPRSTTKFSRRILSPEFRALTLKIYALLFWTRNAGTTRQNAP